MSEIWALIAALEIETLSESAGVIFRGYQEIYKKGSNYMHMLFEIIFKLSAHEKLRDFFDNVVTFEKTAVIDSHFYDDSRNCDLEYSDIDDFCSFTLANSTESSLLLSSANCGISFRKAVILIAHDSREVEISLTAEKGGFNTGMDGCKALAAHLLESISSGIVDSITVGYDPAQDVDMQIIVLQKDGKYTTDAAADVLYSELNCYA